MNPFWLRPPLERGQLSNGMRPVLLLIKIYSWDQNTQRSLDLQALWANSAAEIKCSVEAPALFSSPSLLPQAQPLKPQVSSGSLS